VTRSYTSISAHFVLGPAGETGHDRQAPPRTAFLVAREDLGHGVGSSSIADAEGEPVLDELKLQFDAVAPATAVADRVRHEFARHEEGVLHVTLVDPASAECTS
jgi:hypothetical protein